MQTHELYECNVCGYVYDPQRGEPDDNIPPGTQFDQVPETWLCPICGASKNYFTLKAE